MGKNLKQNKRQLTLGSLFSGSGGFELAGELAGIKPIWNSEIEPFPIAVTCRRFPDVKHYGDVSALSGTDLEPVDIITFGSPCTDLSIAGKRAGLDGEHSGLFHEAIRIIKEMREKTDGQYPRYAVWENVFGAFSSQRGEDFKAVLEAFVQAAEPKAPPVPMPEKGAWPYADILLGDGWSVAYRTLDSQWWGVPQRRRRIFLVADFRGRSAGEILFKSEGVSGYTPQGFRSWKRAAGDTPQSIGEAGSGNGENAERIASNDGAAGFCTEHSANARSIGYEEERSPTLRVGKVPAVVPLDNHPQDSRLEIAEDGIIPTLSARIGTGGNNMPLLMEQDVKALRMRAGKDGGGKGALIQDDVSGTLGCNNDQTLFVPNEQACYWDGSQTAGTLTRQNASGSQRMPDKDNFNCVLESSPKRQAFGISSYRSNAMLSDNPHAGIYEAETSRTLDCSGGSPGQNQGGIAIVEQEKCFDIRQTSDGTKVSRCHCYETDTSRSLSTTFPDPTGNHGGVAVVGQKAYALQGNMIGRTDKNGPQGSGISEDVCYTLTDVDRHAVAAPNPVPDPCYGIDRAAFNQGQNAKFGFSVEKELSPTLVAKGPNAVSKPEPNYTVRRLTPTECARLQGFPDWWCHDLGNPNPSDEEIAFWTDVWETHRRVVSHAAKPKTEKQIRKWLADPYSDSAEYKLWGNGVALPCVYFVMCGIVWAAGKE